VPTVGYHEHTTDLVSRFWQLGIAIEIILILLHTTPVNGLEVMRPQLYRAEDDVTGWLMSEKLDGVRGYWDGKKLLSKNGTIFHPPAQFIHKLPPFPLEGELWAGRNGFERTVSIVKKQSPHDGWLQLQFAIFDVPLAAGGFSERIQQARNWFRSHPSQFAFVIPQIPVRDQFHLQQELSRIEAQQGEGLIVREPHARYESGRSSTILKVKTFHDAEARVVARLPGTGRNEGRLGALLVERADGQRFKIGSGFSNADRDSPPAIGECITYKYYGLYQSGIPKFPVFLRVRRDAGL